MKHNTSSYFLQVLRQISFYLFGSEATRYANLSFLKNLRFAYSEGVRRVPPGTKCRRKDLFGAALAALSLLLSAQYALAHCDGMDGPVVRAAQAALEAKNVNLVLPWVQKADDHQIREAFSRTLEVRNLGAAARELADRYFFETLVRIHRAGEGAPYTGLKPAGLDPGQAVTAADKAIVRGSSTEVEHLLSEVVNKGIHQRFESLLHVRNYDKNNPEQGREYVKRYVSWIHFVAGIYDAAEEHAASHQQEGAEHKHAE